MNANEPAYPSNGGLVNPGLSKRELIAAMALQGLLADESGGEGVHYGKGIAEKRAVERADALLAELKRTAK